MPDVDLTYKVGTCSVGVGATTVIGVGTLWSQSANVRQWDLISIAGGPLIPIVAGAADDTHVSIPAWTGAAQAAVTYVIYQVSPLRFVGGQAMADVDNMLSKLNTDGWYRYVNPVYASPTAQGITANEGQFALKYTTKQLWIMTGGVWVEIPPTIADVARFGIVGDGVTANDAAIATAITYAVANNLTLAFSDGVYCHANTIQWARPGLKVIALGANVAFKHTGTGIAHDFNGLTYGDPSQGVMRGVFGGANRIQLKGNPAGGTTKLVYVCNWHAGEMKIRGRDAQYIFWCDNAPAAPTSSSSVSSKFDIQIGANHDRIPFSVVPLEGVHLDSCNACIFPNLIVEECTNYGLRMLGSCGGNNFFGGVAESIVATGVRIESGCSKNNFYGFDSEGNNTGSGTGKDWIIEGPHNSFYACTGAGTTSGSTLSGNTNLFSNTKFQSLTIQAGASFNDFVNPTFTIAFTDNGTSTAIRNADGGLGIADKIPFRGDVSNTINQNAGTVYVVNNNSTGNAATSGLWAANSVGTAQIGVASINHADPLIANRAYIISSAFHAGIILDAFGANPIVFGVNGVEAGRFTSAGVFAAINGITGASFNGVTFDTDGTLAANSATRSPTQSAVVSYVAARIAALDVMIFKGVLDCSANPNYPAADAGATYRVSVAGKIGGASGTNVEAGDILLCITDGTAAGTQAAVGSSWSVIQVNIDGAVVGPASATSGNAASFNGVTGKLIQDSGKALPSGTIVGTTDAQALTNKTNVLVSSATGGVGYSTGAGGTVTQATSKATGFTLNKIAGQFVTAADALAAGAIVEATFANSAMADGDVIILNHRSGGTRGAYTINGAVGGGGAAIAIRNNTAGSLSEALTINYAIIKSVTS